MAYIGKTPVIGNFQVCDAISVVNNQAAYTMQVGGVNVSPESANHMLVSLNGILQAPTSSFTVSGSTITFASNLVTGDVIDFIQILGNVLDLGVPSDSTVSLAKLTATGTKDATTFLRGDNTFAAAGLNGWSEDGANNNLLPASSSAGIYLGVNSATASNLLDDYEEGTFTPTLLAYAGTPSFSAAQYVKIGKIVYGAITVLLDGTSDGDHFRISSLPFSVGLATSVYGGFVTYTNGTNDKIYVLASDGGNSLDLYTNSGNALTYNGLGSSAQIRIAFFYEVN